MTEDNKKSEEFSEENEGIKSNKKLLKILGIAALVLLILGSLSVLAYNYKHYFVAGRVNGEFVTRPKLNNFLITNYGENALDELINQKLIDQKLAEEDVDITDAEMTAKKEEISLQLEEQQGMNLDEYLKSQDISQKEFEKNLRTQIALEKLFVDQVDVTEEKVDEFMETYGEQIPGETDEEKRARAVDILVDQEIGSLFQQWLQKARTEAEIDTYLE